MTCAVLADDATATAPRRRVDLTAGATYKIAENDFMATGGDGYPNFASRMTTQDIMEQVAADYITAQLAADAGRQGRSRTADQLHGLERRRGAELPDVGSVSVAS